MKQLLILVLIVLLAGCTALSATNKQDLNTNPDDRLLVEDVLQPLTFFIENPKNQEATYGVSFELSKYDNGQWTLIPMKEQMAFILIAYILSPNQRVSETIDLSFYYDNLKDGMYRITKTLHYDDGVVDYHIEFEIKTR